MDQNTNDPHKAAKDIILEICEGNPGAMRMLTDAYAIGGINALTDIKKTGIKGSGLYVVWNDICRKNIAETLQLFRTCPLAVLQDAASRQDYSSENLRENLKQYMKN